MVESCLGVSIAGHISARTVIWKTGPGPALSVGTTTVSLPILSSDSLLIAPSCHLRLLILSLNQQVLFADFGAKKISLVVSLETSSCELG